jgi:hypothetical protein
LGEGMREFTRNELDDKVLTGGANEPRRSLPLSCEEQFQVEEVTPNV